MYYRDMIKYGGIGLIVLFLGIIGSCQMTNYRISQAISNGVAPFEAYCAFSSSDTKVCYYVAGATSVKDHKE